MDLVRLQLNRTNSSYCFLSNILTSYPDNLSLEKASFRGSFRGVIGGVIQTGPVQGPFRGII